MFADFQPSATAVLVGAGLLYGAFLLNGAAEDREMLEEKIKAAETKQGTINGNIATSEANVGKACALGNVFVGVGDVEFEAGNANQRSRNVAAIRQLQNSVDNIIRGGKAAVCV